MLHESSSALVQLGFARAIALEPTTETSIAAKHRRDRLITSCLFLDGFRHGARSIINEVGHMASRAPRARRAADTMQVRHSVGGELELYHMLYIRNVDTPRGNVGTDEYPLARVNGVGLLRRHERELCQRRCSFRGRHLLVQQESAHEALLYQKLVRLPGTVDGVAKDHGACATMLAGAQEMQQRSARVLPRRALVQVDPRVRSRALECTQAGMPVSRVLGHAKCAGLLPIV